LRSSKNRYLVEDHALAYAPSVTALREMTKSFSARSSAQSLLAFGNPVINSQTAERLTLVTRAGVDSSPDSETEVKSLERLYTAAGGRAFVGAQANESAAKQQLGKFTRIHFAAPALLNDASPLYSHIALSQSNDYGNDDGLLEVWELMRMDLRIDLLTLSASQPAQERMSGEGFIGWSWGSFVAGCSTTVLSQWKVTSPSTTELMLAFHQNLKSHDSDAAVGSSNKSRKAVEDRQSRFGINAAQSLRGAMLKLLSDRRYHHPYYWAGFEVIGNGR
jgi:CHAT domain-containing protein